MASPVDVGTGALVAATAAAFSFGGVDSFHLLMGASCYVVGNWGRAGLKIAAALEAEPPQKYGAYIASACVAPLLGSMCSLMMFLAAHVVGFEGDAPIALVLALSGFRGQEGLQALVSMVSGVVPKTIMQPKTEQKP